MLFWFLFSLAGVLLAASLVIAVGAIVLWLIPKNRFDGDDCAITCATSLLPVMVAMFPFMFVFSAWSGHASDLAKVDSQHYRITVYQERVEALEDRLSNAQYPEKPDISLDADTPWATMMKSLDNAETELAKAKDQRAIAIRSISARKRGPMSGVVTLVGDIDPDAL